MDQAADLVVLYVDGQHAGLGSIARISDSGCGITELAYYIGGTGSSARYPRQFFDGTIDELRVYTGVLSAGEIAVQGLPTTPGYLQIVGAFVCRSSSSPPGYYPAPQN